MDSEAQSMSSAAANIMAFLRKVSGQGADSRKTESKYQLSANRRASQEESEMSRAKRVSLQQLHEQLAISVDICIEPLAPHTSPPAMLEDDIWKPQDSSTQTCCAPTLHHTFPRTMSTPNFRSASHQRIQPLDGSLTDSPRDSFLRSISEQHDGASQKIHKPRLTMNKSTDTLLLSPATADEEFPATTDHINGNSTLTRRKSKLPSDGAKSDLSEKDEGLCMTDDDQASDSRSSEARRKTISYLTNSSCSLESLQEEVEPSGLRQDHHKSPVPVNSHLHADPSVVGKPPGSSAQLAMYELVKTEGDYCKALELVIEQYIPEMECDNVPNGLRGKRGVIFGNIESIHKFHCQTFLRLLKRCEMKPFSVGLAFLEHKKEFMAYAFYNKNKPRSDEALADHGAAFFRSVQSRLRDHMDLSSYLLKPVQRIGKYALILGQLVKECPEGLQKEELLGAEEMIRFCLQHGNDLLALDSLKDCHENLIERGRLLLQAEFTVSLNKGKMAARHLFLFEQILVLAKPHKVGAVNDYLYKSSLKMADIGLTENISSSDVKFELWYKKLSPEKTWTFTASSSQIKQQWVKTIRKLKCDQAYKIRNFVREEQESMGYERKRNQDLATSYNINDRVLDINLSRDNSPKLTPELTKQRSPFSSLRRPRKSKSISSFLTTFVKIPEKSCSPRRKTSCYMESNNDVLFPAETTV